MFHVKHYRRFDFFTNLQRSFMTARDLSFILTYKKRKAPMGDEFLLDLKYILLLNNLIYL